MIRIKNGGIELGLLRAVQEDGANLSDTDLRRMEYLDSLPKDEWFYLNENGQAISDEEAIKRMSERYKLAQGGAA